MFSQLKQNARRRRLIRHGVLPVDTTVAERHPIVFYGDRMGVWPLCPVLKPASSVVYSFGLGDNISWELALIENHQAQVFAFDPTPQTAVWIESQTVPPGFSYAPVGLADAPGEIEFFVPRKTGRYNYSVVQRGLKYPTETVRCPVSDFATLCRSNGHSRVDVLKLDIEGSEMTALPGILRGDVFFGQLLVEFHYNYPGIELTDTVALIDQLKARGYTLFWCSDRAYEFGFVHHSVLGEDHGPAG